MVNKAPLYISLSSDNVWYYQRWVPKHLHQSKSRTSPVFRASLRTKNKQKALRIARLMSVKFDQLATQFFDSPEQFGEAMKLLHRAASAYGDGKSFNQYEEDFLIHLDESDDYLLSKADNFSNHLKSEFQRLERQVAALTEAIKSNSHPTTEAGMKTLLDNIQETINPTLPDNENPTLNELYKLWVEANGSRIAKTSLKNAFQPAIELFIKLIDNFERPLIRANELQSGHIRAYQTFYKQLPKGTDTKKYAIAQLLKFKGESKSEKTIQDNYSCIGTFLNWSINQGYPINPTLTRILTKGSETKVNSKQSKQRMPFTDDELKRLFNSDKYIKTGKFSTSAMYWTGLISLLSGARMTEILQLERHDVYQVENVWVLNIDDIDHLTSDEDKHVKRDGSRREVPIHKQLIKLGFIDYIKTRKGALFPDENRNDNGKFDKFQKRHTTYRKQVKVVPTHSKELRDFHSFRHTVRTRLSELRTIGPATKRFDEGLIDAIVGHESKDRSIGQSTYNHTQFIDAKNKALNRLQYPSIDFDKIINWKRCSFAREPARRKAKEKLTSCQR